MVRCAMAFPVSSENKVPLRGPEGLAQLVLTASGAIAVNLETRHCVSLRGCWPVCCDGKGGLPVPSFGLTMTLAAAWREDKACKVDR